MGIVSKYLRDVIGKQVDDRRIVVWFDPERHYEHFATTLALPNTHIACYTDSFIALRHGVSALLEGEEPPRLVVYVPQAEDQTQDALVELTAAGVVLQPGQQPWQRNTRLSVIARAALKDTLGADQLRTIEKQVESGQLSLADLDRMGTGAGSGESSGVISIIFGTGNPEEVALGVLGGTQYDATIAEKRALPDITRLLSGTYGVELSAEESLHEVRVRLARHVLCTELLATLPLPLPAQLATVRAASDPAARDACVHLARRWRQTRDLAESYAVAALRVEPELGLRAIPFELSQIQHVETFAAIDAATQAATERAIQQDPSPALLALVASRQRGYWADRVPEARARWTLIGIAGRLLQLAQEIEQALRGTELAAGDLFRRYTEGEQPWCALDTAQREMEQHAHRFDFTAKHTMLSELLATARRRYMEVGSMLAERYTHALERDGFRLTGIPRQTAMYASVVAPALREGKTAYVLVDAFRYEMARDLAPALRDYADVEIAPAVGTVPTITEIGMAALLPGAETGAHVVPAGGGKLALEIAGTPLRDRTSRIEWLRSHATLAASGGPATVCDATLGELLVLRRELKAKIEAADLVVITSQEFDEAGESDNITMARTVMDTLLVNLARGLRKLGDLGCQQIIVAADHGYLFGDELDTDMKIESPGGQQFDLHRRVWVGRGGAANPAYLRAPLSAFGLSADDTEIATPWGFGVFRVQGGTSAYFHGGMSLPEMVIPVLTLTAHATPTVPSGDEIEWIITLGSKTISTRFCTVQITGRHGGLFDITLAPIRVEVHQGGEVISQPVAAAYGFREATGDVQMAFQADDTRELVPNSVTLMITHDDLPAGLVSVHLLDGATGRELRRLDAVEIAIAI